jgi:hypothetical protein
VYPDTLNRGKYRGVPLDQVPRSYLLGLQNRKSTGPALRAAVVRELRRRRQQGLARAARLPTTRFLITEHGLGLVEASLLAILEDAELTGAFQSNWHLDTAWELVTLLVARLPPAGGPPPLHFCRAYFDGRFGNPEQN